MLKNKNSVYWGVVLDNNFSNTLIAHQPKPVYNFLKNFNTEDIGSNFLKCPASRLFLKNRYTILSPINYTLNFDSQRIWSPDFNQKAFESWVNIRDLKLKIISLNVLKYVFFTEEKCNLTLSSTYLSNTEISSQIDLVSGSFDISSWLRPTDFCFVVKKNVNNISIKRGDRLFDITFNFIDDKPVNLIKFFVTNKLISYIDEILSCKSFVKPKNLHHYFNFYYELFNKSKIKNLILKEIKQNIMEDS